MMSKPSMTSWADAATISKADTRLDIAVIGERKGETAELFGCDP